MTEQARSQLSPRHSQLNEVDAVTDPSEKQRNPAGEEMDCKDKHKVAEASAQYLADIAPQSTPEDDTCPPGYKRTEVGVIPEDWEVQELGNVLTLQRGFDLPTRLRKEGNVPIISSSGVSGFHNKSAAKAPGIVTGRYGTIGEIFYVHDDYWPLNTTLYVKEYKTASPEYIFHLLKTVEFESYSGKSGVPGINRNDIHQEKVAIPPEKEQTAIANALSDMDALIGELEKLIAKKQAIKTATMQQLLTGRTRLPPFAFKESALREDGTHTNSSGTNLDAGTGGPKGEGQDGLRNGYKQSELGEIPEDWEVVELGSIIEKVVGGGTPSRSNNSYWGNEIPWVTVKDFTNFCPTAAQESITKYGLKNSASNLIPKGTLIISTRMALGKAVIYKIDVAINQDLKALYCGSYLNTKFLYFWFEFNSNKISDLGSGSTVKGLSLSDLIKIEFLLPSIKEQTAIATILSDMDEEIQALQQRLAKTRQIKQGMMQELLTGRTRLVKPEQEVA